MTYYLLWHRLLKLYDSNESQAIVRILLEERFGLTLTDIVSGAIERLSESQKEELEAMMHRLEDGEPLQYVLGYTYFYGRKFHVEPGVLIPRPETEELCRIIINDFKEESVGERNERRRLKLLDVGTGSGCIAITLSLEIPDAEVYALDISEKALQIARNNAEALQADVHFFQQDILKASLFREGMGDVLNVAFDGIVSNPPYVIESERGGMGKNVLNYEPSSALFVPDDDPLLFYNAITDFSNAIIDNSNAIISTVGWLYFEINPLFANELKSMLQSKGFSDVEIINDSFGKQRFAKAIRK